MSFGTSLWDGDTANPTSVGVALSGLLNAALRKAGITKRPGITPGVDETDELIAELNRMLGHYNLDGHRIYSSAIVQYSLTASQKVYTIGPGGDMDGVRPNWIASADIIFPTTPQIRYTVRVTTDVLEWESLTVQDIPGAPTWFLYYDRNYDANGLASIYIFPQPPAGYLIELSQWLRLTTTFASISDLVVLPDGYEDLIVNNLAVRAASLYPLEAKIDPLTVILARETLQAVITLNTTMPRIGTEPGLARGDRSEPYPWLTGGIR